MPDYWTVSKLPSSRVQGRDGAPHHEWRNVSDKHSRPAPEAGRGGASMSATKKAAQVLQHQDGGEQTRLDGFDELPENHFITRQDTGQAISIASLLLRGSANAVPLQHLRAVTGLDGRAIRRMIQAERRSGAAICADNRTGYYLAATPEERESCARSMLARADEVRRTAQAIAAAEVVEDV